MSNRSWAPWFAAMVERRNTDRWIAENRRREREYWERVAATTPPDLRLLQFDVWKGMWLQPLRDAFGPRKTP